ncbi:hypothetical protein HDF16_006096 [Granulicella aggregans]|uniref:Dolichyl-phosphate-mannose-protein mannosyltransferase n=1 Tax=Granulicella aggregans TaxID=474949 RepID=A0A7W7ZK26_9BACT|nr:glycosyltransferase family 39 protein [Granulicella aggregans]MBB5061360.1 hypothetical protein [Granulicella aggregans]
MHYIAFLMDRGMAPYRDVIDVNMPGTYGTEWAVMHVFGPNAMAWRIWDIFLACAATGAMMVIAKPVDRLAGLFGGGLFFLLHGRDGIAELGQRDLLMATALLWSTALLIRSARKRSFLCLALGGLLAGFATTVKPTSVLFWLAMISFIAIQDNGPSKVRWKFFVIGSGAMLVAPLTAALALYRIHALAAFWNILTGLIPYHNAMFRLPATYFASHLIPSTLLPLSLTMLTIICLRPRRGMEFVSRDEALILIGVVCGAVSFWVQRKAFSYHRYPMNAFLILLVSLVLFKAIRDRNATTTVRGLAMAGVALGAFVLAPQCLVRVHELSSSPNDFSNLLQRDLLRLGGLDGKVQCIDFTSGCTTTLYRMRLVPATGFLYDCYAYGPDTNAVVREYRESFWRELTRRPPAVMVVSNQSCSASETDGFKKLERWPALADMIRDQYVLEKEVIPPDAVRWVRQVAVPHRYRIYLRR